MSRSPVFAGTADCADAEEALAAARALVAETGLDAGDEHLDLTGADPTLPVRYPLGIAAAGVFGACGVALARLLRARAGPAQPVGVAVPLAAAGLVSFRYLRLDGQPIASPGDGNPLVGLYRCRDDRWVAIHGGFPSLEAGTLGVLGVAKDRLSRDAIAAAIASRDSPELEDTLAAARMCGVVVHGGRDWLETPTGRSLAGVPPIEIERIGDAPAEPLPPASQPLAGVRVLDCTRILAGPTCGRLLAAAGADVLTIGAPHRPNIPAYALETSQGKRSAWVDLDTLAGHARALDLARGCDVFVDSYRSGSLEARGFGPHALAERRPGVVCVQINCYGHHSDWETRPGWEMMGQAATGLAVGHGSPDQPLPLWCYPCDYLTGYLAALGAVVALARRATEGGSWRVRASLCRTGMYTEAFGNRYASPPPAIDVAPRYCRETDTPRGRLRFLPLPIDLPRSPLGWTRFAGRPGADSPRWL